MCHEPGVAGRCFHTGGGTGPSTACCAAGFWLKRLVLLCRNWRIQPQGLEAEGSDGHSLHLVGFAAFPPLQTHFMLVLKPASGNTLLFPLGETEGGQQ